MSSTSAAPRCEYLEATLDNPLAHYKWVICGPEAMSSSIKAELEEGGVQPKHILLESFDIR